MQRVIRSMLALLLLTSVLAFLPAAHVEAQQATPDGVSTATPSAISGRFTGLVDIGSRSLWVSCLGEGSPTVILESGSPGMDAGDWYGVQAGIAKVTHVCAYDRANVGGSDPAPTPRTVQQMADDLHALLTAAGIPGPYVLAATSFGPLVSRIYASTYPEDVAGLVLIDPVSEDLEVRFEEVLPPEVWARRMKEFWSGNPEGIALDESYAQVRASAPLPAVPLLVIVHDDASLDSYLFPTNWPVEVLDPIWKELVADQARLVPGGRLVVAEHTGHGMVFFAAEFVADAVLQVVEAVRDPSTWAASATPEVATPGP
jgi:pimeloyl-ACP methyl ester carboxylesterase